MEPAGDAPEAKGQYENLVEFIRKKQVRQLPPVRVASTGYSAQAVLNARLIAQLFGGAGGRREEAAEFNVTRRRRPASTAEAGK